MVLNGGNKGGRWNHTNKKTDKKRSISGTFKRKKKPTQLVTLGKFAAYRWGDEEEDATYRTRDPLVRTDFFIIPKEPQYEHYFKQLDPLLYGNREHDGEGYGYGGGDAGHPRGGAVRGNVSYAQGGVEEEVDSADDAAAPAGNDDQLQAYYSKLRGKAAAPAAAAAAAAPASSKPAAPAAAPMAKSSFTTGALKKLKTKKAAAPAAKKLRSHTTFSDDE